MAKTNKGLAMTIENTIYGELPNTDIALGFDRNGKFSGGSFIAIIDPYARNNIAELVKQLSKYGEVANPAYEKLKKLLEQNVIIMANDIDPRQALQSVIEQFHNRYFQD